MDLIMKSIEIIKNNQSEKGAFIASPAFPTYHFSWLRDGSYIAYSMDIMGEHAAAQKFYTWVNDVIVKYRKKVDTIAEKISSGQKVDVKDFLNARYTLEGSEEKEDGWGNFQLDGYGTWLWGLGNHIKLTGDTELISKFKVSIDTTIKYIENLWDYPNYDIWEENSDKIHTSTLACLYGGLKEINSYLRDNKLELLANKIKTYILTNCTADNKFVKYIGTKEVDSSLTWLGVPFNVVDISDEVFVNTIKEIEDKLLHNGGVHRYEKDTYYGGGEWILLSSWLGWYYAKSGQIEKAKEIRNWVENQADEKGNLTEQVCNHVNDKIYYPYWVSEWGNVANPLLWSHAMYLVLNNAIKTA